MPLMMLIIYGTIIAVMWYGGQMVYAGFAGRNVNGIPVCTGDPGTDSDAGDHGGGHRSASFRRDHDSQYYDRNADSAGWDGTLYADWCQ